MPTIIEIFGIDGAGKTTLTHNLKSELNDRGILTQIVSPLQLSDPYFKSIRALIQKIPKSKRKFHERAETFFASYFSYAFVDHFLKAYLGNLDVDVIICDRYVNSHFLNQASFGADLTGLEPLFALLPKPTLSLMISLPLEMALSRLNLRGNIQRHEEEEFLRKSQEKHLEFSTKNKIVLLDGALSRKELTFHTIDVLAKQGIKIPAKRS